MKFIIYIIITISLGGCIRKSPNSRQVVASATSTSLQNDNIHAATTITTLTYENTYKDDRLIRTIVSTVENLNGQSVNQTHEEYEYVYSTDPKRIEKYKIGTDGTRHLESMKIINGLEEINMKLSGRDTINYSRIKLDKPDGNVIYYHSKYSMANNTEKNDTEHTSEYDSNGRIISTKTRNFIGNTTAHIKYNYSQRGDTLVRISTRNGTPDQIIKIISSNGTRVEWSYDASGNLCYIFSSTTHGVETIEIREDKFFNTVDSVFLSNGLEVRKVYMENNYKSITTTEYDVHGNKIKEVFIVQNASNYK